MAQIEEFEPPPNPAKITDPRATDYIEKYGQVSWEVDAIEPQDMERIVIGHIEENIDMEKYEEILLLERSHKAALKGMIESYGKQE